MRKILWFLLLTGLCFAEQTTKQELPIGFTDWEWENRHLIYEMNDRQTDPPNAPVRAIAEFERMQGVLIRYPFGVSTSVISEMAEDAIVYCLVSASQQSSAQNTMENGGVNMDNVEFVTGATDSYWTRDYGPWWAVDGNGEVVVVDHTYNRPRPNDNAVPERVSNHLVTSYFYSDIVSAGGNFMTDGLGIGASSELIYEENPGLSENEVHEIMDNYYGLHTYHGIPDPNNTYIDHIDCWGKFLSPTKVLIRSVPESHSQYDELEATAQYFAENMTAWNEPWEVFRVYTPNNQPYTNSLILNEKVLVPIMNGSYDDDALAVYQEALPGYEVLGFSGSWESTDALHCRTKGIPDLDMLQIFHNPINNQDLPLDEYPVIAVIAPLSTMDLVESELFVAWKNSLMDDYEFIPMTPTGNENEYSCAIPSQPVDTDVWYFIHAGDEAGNSDTLPIAGYFDFVAVGGVPAQPGDVNLDDDLNVLDIVSIVGHILGTAPLEGYPAMLADVNGDGNVNVLDVISLINVIVGG